MSKVLVIYGSTTGSTEETANMIEQHLQDKNVEVKVENVTDVGPLVFKEDYDAFLLGCSTWGEETIELQDDFIELYDSMADTQFEGLKIGVFGCGDSSYTYFCGAVDSIVDRVEKNGAEILLESLKVDGDPSDTSEEIRDWALEVADKL